MPATPNTSTYITGYGWTVTLGSISWAQSKSVSIPEPELGVVEIQALNGLQVVGDGDKSFGVVTVIVPQDGSSSLYGTTITSGTASNGTRTATFSGIVTKDGGGTVTRGSSVDRTITIALTSKVAWS